MFFYNQLVSSVCHIYDVFYLYIVVLIKAHYWCFFFMPASRTLPYCLQIGTLLSVQQLLFKKCNSYAAVRTSTRFSDQPCGPEARQNPQTSAAVNFWWSKNKKCPVLKIPTDRWQLRIWCTQIIPAGGQLWGLRGLSNSYMTKLYGCFATE